MIDETKTKRPRPRGTGSIYTRPGSKQFWIQYYRNGHVVRESARTSDRRKAEKFLAHRIGEIATGTFVGLKVERVTVAELAEDVLRDYRIHARKSEDSTEARWRLHLQPFFGHFRAIQVSSDVLARYIDERLKENAESATVNRELAFLKRAFRLGQQATPPKVRNIPHFTTLRENNVRKGFLGDEQYGKLAAECAKEGLWLRAMLAAYYNFGWRKGELLGLRVGQVDLSSRTIRLEVGETKNSQGRTVKMPDEVFHLLAACIHGKKENDHVFTRPEGSPVRDFRKAWEKVCVAAGLGRITCRRCKEVVAGRKCQCGSKSVRYEGLILHDLRRTGARNLRRIGVGETTAMKIGGWKTPAVFQRYDIVSEADLADAARRLDDKREALAKAAENRHSSSTVSDLDAPKEAKQMGPVVN